MVRTRAMARKGKSKVNTKTRGGKKKTTKKQKKSTTSKKILKGKRRTTRVRRTYKNTEEKRNDILYKMIKSYKQDPTICLDEILMTYGGEDSSNEYDGEGVNYLDAAKQLLEHYKSKTFDLSQFVFNKDVFEMLLSKMKMAC